MFDSKMIIGLLILVALIYFVTSKPKMSNFVLEGAPYESESQETMTAAPLLPKETPVSEDFSQFSTDAILSNQNYLDPRNMIGYPETVGGTLRNANLQIRSEPPNPRDPVSIFNLSTIVPEQMRPLFEIQDNDYK
jgi:hypothetical protein